MAGHAWDEEVSSPTKLIEGRENASRQTPPTSLCERQMLWRRRRGYRIGGDIVGIDADGDNGSGESASGSGRAGLTQIGISASHA